MPQLLSLRSRALEPQLLKPELLEPMLCNKRSHHNEKPVHSNEDPTQPKINLKKKEEDGAWGLPRTRMVPSEATLRGHLLPSSAMPYVSTGGHSPEAPGLSTVCP